MNTPAWANRLPGEAAPAGDPGAFHAADAWADHLAAYAASNALPVVEGSPVTGLAATADGGWTIRVGGSEPREVEARRVVVASGMQRSPRLPAMARSVPDGVLSLHAADYRSAGALPPGGVLVVGSAQSGCQIAEDLLAGGRQVWLAASPAPRMPRRYRGREIFEWLVPIGFFDQAAADLPDPAMRWWPVANISGVGPGGHTVSLQSVAALGAALAGRVASIAGDRVRFAPDLGPSITMGDRTSSAQRQRIDAWIEARGIAAPPPGPDPADRAVDDLGTIATPDHLDLAEAGVGTVLWATGFGPDLGWLDPALIDAHGLPIHADGAARVPGLWFLGVPWQRTRKSSIVMGADEDGAFVAERVLASLG